MKPSVPSISTGLDARANGGDITLVRLRAKAGGKDPQGCNGWINKGRVIVRPGRIRRTR